MKAVASRVSEFVVLMTAAVACSQNVEKIPPARETCAGGHDFAFAPVPPSSGEGYSCFAFDARVVDFPIAKIIWTPLSSGAVLHHATLHATSETRPIGVDFDCDPMPQDAVALHTWAPGGSPLELADGLAIALPANTRTLIVEAHVYAQTTGPTGTASVELCPSPSPPTRIAGRLSLSAPVPAIRPHTVETSTSRCRLRAAFHVISSWPHMHRIGAAFHGALLHGEERVSIVDVAPWNFGYQITYRATVDAELGDLLETSCTWENDGDDYVLPGIYTENEMCTQGLLGWPAEAAVCDYQ